MSKLINKKTVFNILTTAIMSLMLHVNVFAYPITRNYNKKAYGGGTQNWEICQDSFGRMLFANNSGLLTYDSQKWTLNYIGNYTTVRSVFFDENSGRIYAGGSEDFGYFSNSTNSKGMEYVSLVETIPQRDRHFNEIWEIHKYGNYFWFQSDFCIFRYDGKKTTAIPYKYKITASKLINGHLLVASKEGGVCILNGNNFIPVSGNEAIVGKRICAILPYLKSDVLLVTEMSGIFRYDGNSIKPFVTDIDGFLKENQVFCAATNNREIVFGTVNNGVVIKDLVTNANTYVNTKTGLQNNTVLSIYFDKSDNIWLGLDNGIDYVMYNSPISTLFGTNEYGAGYTSLLKGGILYLGTNQGVYTTPYPIKPSPDPLPLKKLTKSQTWSIDTIGSSVLVSNDRGLFCLNGNAMYQVEGIPGTWSVIPLRKHPQHALASTYEGFFLLKQSGSRWVLDNKLEGYNEAGSRSIIEDRLGYIWISHWMKGVFRLHISSDLQKFDEVKLYDYKKGFPTSRNNTLYVIDGRLSFSTEGGFYRYDYNKDKMIPDTIMNGIFGVRTSIRLYQSPKKDIWGVSSKYICEASYNATGKYDIDTVTYKPMLNRMIIGFENFNFTSPRNLIVSNEDGFFEINTDNKHSTGWHGKLFINRIYATGFPKDSLIYTPGNKDFKELKLPYKLNSLKFEFILPEYREQGTVQYSYYLENYDSEWSAYTDINSKEYTKLREGTYTLHIRTYNEYDNSRSELAFQFTIAPPWFRSVWAIIVYVIALLAAIYYAVRLIREKSRKAAISVAKKKEAELAEFKRKADKETLLKENEINRLKSEQLEHDIKHKSQELSSATMNVIRKNEILIDIQHMIGKIQQSDDKTAFTPGINRQLSKIQQLIKENISHDDDWQKFAHNFDIVYENYLKRLTAKHPNLTIGDQRLCAYLKMGLSSKEIAPLLNMSYRSVEMSRYRLRKKMDLNREINLVEYLQHL